MSTSTLTPQISAEDIERMRTLVAQHDTSNKLTNREFDLNNPPKEQYIHQNWPVAVYHHKTLRVKPARNEAELAEALKHGWVKEAFPQAAAEPELDEDDQAELRAVEAALKAAKRKAADAAKAKK